MGSAGNFSDQGRRAFSLYMGQPVEEKITFLTPAMTAAWATIKEPQTLVRASVNGSSMEVRKLICAPRWKITSGFNRFTNGKKSELATDILKKAALGLRL